MADLKISQLTAATTPLAGTEEVPLVQSGATKKVSVADLTLGRAVSMGNLTYTGTLTGSTGILNIGSGQVYKAADGKVGLNTTSPLGQLQVRSAYPQVWMEDSTAGTNGKFTTIGTNNGTTVISRYLDNGTLVGNYVTVSSVGDVTVNAGNLVPGTAAKGINFTANTPAAGMTSQLLNWYEEGTWTPVVTSGTGSITTVGAVSGRYTRIGRVVVATYSAVITNNGTGASNLQLAGIPFAASAVTIGAGQTTSTGKTTSVYVASGGTTLFVTYYDGTYPIASGETTVGTITYFV